MKKRKTELLEKAANILNVPSEALAGTPRVTITGTGKAHIENHCGLLGYTTEEVLVNGRGVMIKLRGKNLELEAMSDMELLVVGTISSVEYLK